MARYIDADGLKIEFMDLELDHCQGTDYREANQVIDDYPTADVEKVVRCKNCRWGEYNEIEKQYLCRYFIDTTTAEDFCSYGEEAEVE